MLSLLMRGYKHDSKSKSFSKRQVLDCVTERRKIRYTTKEGRQRLGLFI